MRPPVRPVFVAASGGALVATAWAWCFRAMLATLPVTHGPAPLEHREERPAMVEAEPTPPIEEKVERRVVVVKRPRLGGVERRGGPPGPPGGITGGFSPNGGLHAGDSGEFGKRGR
jgi:hypothetical protein